MKISKNLFEIESIACEIEIVVDRAAFVCALFDDDLSQVIDSAPPATDKDAAVWLDIANKRNAKFSGILLDYLCRLGRLSDTLSRYISAEIKGGQSV